MTATRLNPEPADMSWIAKSSEISQFRIEYVASEEKCTVVFNDKFSIDFRASGSIQMYKNNNGTWQRQWSK